VNGDLAATREQLLDALTTGATYTQEGAERLLLRFEAYSSDLHPELLAEVSRLVGQYGAAGVRKHLEHFERRGS
jgi:hypothetical protein